MINWPALGQALKGWPWGKKKWLSKHLAGFSATGRVMLRRDKWAHSKCPHCDQPNEDATHITTCAKARPEYHRLLEELVLPKLREAYTDPDITRVIMSRLRNWMIPFRANFRDTSTKIRHALHQQDSLGWLQFTYGRLARGWDDAQEEWLTRTATKYKKSVRKWSETVIQSILEVTWGMWEHRNTTLHDENHPWRIAARRVLEDSIHDEYQRHPLEPILTKDKHLFSHTMDHLIKNYDDEMKIQWLSSVKLARTRWLNLQARNRAAARNNLNRWLAWNQPA